MRRRGGQYAAFDNRAVAGKVRLLTNAPLDMAALVGDIDTALFEAPLDVGLPEVDS